MTSICNPLNIEEPARYVYDGAAAEGQSAVGGAQYADHHALHPGGARTGLRVLWRLSLRMRGVTGQASR